MTLDLSWWSRLAGLLAVEAALVIAVAGLVARWLRSPQMQRAVWQAALLGVALLWVAELTGARGQFAKLRPTKPVTRTLSVRLLDAPRRERVSASEPFPGEELAAVPRAVPPAQPVWWPGALWLTGLALLVGRLLLARVSLAWCALKTREGLYSPPQRPADAEPADTDAIVARLRRRLGLRRVRVRVWPRLRGPVAFGVLWPTVALPADFTTRFSPAQREAMLAHELAHLAAHDPLWLALADLVCALAWWHPAVWWARRQLRSACESAADEAAALVPDGRAALAESLVTFGRELASPRWTRGLGVAGDGLKSQLARRVTVLLRTHGEWRAVRPARLWLMRFGAVVLTTTFVALPWPGAGEPSLPTLLAAARAEEVAPMVKVKARDTTLPRVVEHGEPGNSKVQVLDIKMPMTASSYSSIAATRLQELTHGSYLINGISYELDPHQGSYGFLPLDPLKNHAAQSTDSSNTAINSSRPSSHQVYVALRDPLTELASTHSATNGNALLTRLYKVETATFLAGVYSVASGVAFDPAAATATNRLAQAQQEVWRFFQAAGVDFPEPTAQPNAGDQDRRALFLNYHTGVLFVRATAADHEVVERAVQALNVAATTQVTDPAMPKAKFHNEHDAPLSTKAATASPRQVELTIQFVEITEGGGDDLGLDWLFGQSPTNNPALQNGPATNLLTGPNAPHGQNLRVDLLRTEGQSTTLTAAQFAALQTRFKERSRVDYLSAPKVITQAGRQARIEVGEAKTVVTGAGVAKSSATNKAGIRYQTEQISTGPAVDLIATNEGDSWRLSILASVTEFLGYDEPKPGQVVSAAQPGDKPVTGTVPLPRLRVRNVQANSLAKNGETVALRGPWVDEVIQFKDKVPVLGDIPLLGRMFRSEGKSTVRKSLYIFVTPIELTATGERKK
jgi:Zn-dependent protease with chaperone function